MIKIRRYTEFKSILMSMNVSGLQESYTLANQALKLKKPNEIITIVTKFKLLLCYKVLSLNLISI